jgi:hypothetical protein
MNDPPHIIAVDGRVVVLDLAPVPRRPSLGALIVVWFKRLWFKQKIKGEIKGMLASIRRRGVIYRYRPVINMTVKPATPECEKLYPVKDKSQAIGEFLDWLKNEKHYLIAERVVDDIHEDSDLMPVWASTEKLLAEYFEIDLNTVERENQELLEHRAEPGTADHGYKF